MSAGSWVVHAPPSDGCAACGLNTYALRLEFGFDGEGPWAALGCSEDGCEAHEAVRPLFVPGEEPPREDGYLGMLLDVAEEDGWRLDHGAWCPTHISD